MAGDVRTPELHVDEPEAEITMSFDFEPVSSAPPKDAPSENLVASTRAPEEKSASTGGDVVEVDEFGLPINPRPRAYTYDSDDDDSEDDGNLTDAKESGNVAKESSPAAVPESKQPAEESKVPKQEPEIAGKEEKSAEQPRERPVSLSLAELPTEEKKENEQRMFPETPAAAPTATVSEWSHQHIVPVGLGADKDGKDEKGKEEDEWQAMPAYASFDMWDDDGRLIARAHDDSDDEDDNQLGGASKGYTRVNVDEDAQSATSMDENTQYLFKETDDDDAARNPLSQMQATKDLLTEGQRIAYVGVCRLALAEMSGDLSKLKANGRSASKQLQLGVESMKMWSQKMMVRLYTHMEISPPEQIMIEQLAQHGVLPSDLTPALMKNARVHNPMAESTTESPRPSSTFSSGSSVSRAPSYSKLDKHASTTSFGSVPPPYEEHTNDEMPEVQTPSQLPQSKTLDIDLRWTVLCDLFLVLIADSVYDARSRSLLERVARSLEVPWLDICRFEKRVTDALEMQESTEQNWTEAEHIENRQKQARNRRYMMMGLATVGGGLVIGLSGGLLAPLIGAGLAAGFTTIGVAGTSGFLAGTGGTALIASGAVVSGSYIGGKAGFNRSKAVQTFEFRPLHNAKRVNLIITVAGWMNGKVDDVRLPFSTVDPIMGDIFSVFWEPEMLQSMGQTINILATEALTQTVQQVLGSTILMGLMASLQLPIVLTKLSYLVDNPWSVSLVRAESAGLILADSLMHRNLGVRPVTLVGYSLGARVIYSCLQELSKHGAYGLVQNVYLFGSPVVVRNDEYAKALSVVSSRFVNGYASNDWILGYLFRATSGGLRRIAGLAPVEGVEGVENIDVTDLVNGHMDYRQAMPRIMIKMGWEVLSEEFTEIEDPDPDQHRERQRELINEIDEARKELDSQPEKKRGRFSFFGRGKEAKKKKDWETYEAQPAGDSKNGDTDNSNSGVLFDVDAIRAELAREGTSKSDDATVKEVEKTMADMKLAEVGGGRYGDGGLKPVERDGLRQTKSYSEIEYSKEDEAGWGKNTGSFATLPVYEGKGWGSEGEDEYASGTHDKIELSFEPSAPPPVPRKDPYVGGYSGFGSVNSRTSFGSSSHERNGTPPVPRKDSYGSLSGGYSALGSGGFSNSRSGSFAMNEDRPALKNSYTAPSLGGAVGERNVWADDDDDEFQPKGDGEIAMTFA